MAGWTGWMARTSPRQVGHRCHELREPLRGDRRSAARGMLLTEDAAPGAGRGTTWAFVASVARGLLVAAWSDADYLSIRYLF